MKERFAAESAEKLLSQLEAGELPPSFTRGFRAHLQDYGDRGLQELKMEQPNLRHQPEILMRTIQGYVQSEVAAGKMKEAETALRAAAEARLAGRLAEKPVRLFVLRQLLKTG